MQMDKIIGAWQGSNSVLWKDLIWWQLLSQDLNWAPAQSTQTTVFQVFAEYRKKTLNVVSGTFKFLPLFKPLLSHYKVEIIIPSLHASPIARVSEGFCFMNVQALCYFRETWWALSTRWQAWAVSAWKRLSLTWWQELNQAMKVAPLVLVQNPW